VQKTFLNHSFSFKCSTVKSYELSVTQTLNLNCNCRKR